MQHSPQSLQNDLESKLGKLPDTLPGSSHLKQGVLAYVRILTLNKLYRNVNSKIEKWAQTDENTLSLSLSLSYDKSITQSDLHKWRLNKAIWLKKCHKMLLFCCFCLPHHMCIIIEQAKLPLSVWFVYNYYTYILRDGQEW